MIGETNLKCFVTTNSKSFFDLIGSTSSFLDRRGKEWLQDENYVWAKEMNSQIKVVNIISERGVKLIYDYDKISPKDEELKQCLSLTTGKASRQKQNEFCFSSSK